MDRIWFRDPLMQKKPQAQTHSTLDFRALPSITETAFSLISHIPCRSSAGWKRKSMWEHVKLALGLLLHHSSLVDFKEGGKRFRLPPAEMVHLEKHAGFNKCYFENTCSVKVK